MCQVHGHEHVRCRESFRAHAINCGLQGIAITTTERTGTAARERDDASASGLI